MAVLKAFCIVVAALTAVLYTFCATAAALAAIVYAIMAAVMVTMDALFLLIKSTIIAIKRSVADEDVITCFMTGASFSPNTTDISVKPFRALSRPACTVVF